MTYYHWADAHHRGLRDSRGTGMKKFYLAAVCIVLAQPALAGAREDARAAEQRCSVLQDDRSWLECSYGALQVMRAKLGLQPAPDYQQRLVPPAPQGYAPAPAPVASLVPPPVPATAAGTRAATAVPPRLPALVAGLAMQRARREQVRNPAAPAGRDAADNPAPAAGRAWPA